MHLTSVAIQLEQMTVILETAYLNGYDAGYGVGYNIGYGDGERDSIEQGEEHATHNPGVGGSDPSTAN